MAQTEGEPMFRNLEEGEKLNESLINELFVLIPQRGQTAQLIMYMAKNGNFEGLCLALSPVNKGGICESCLHLMGKGGSLQ